jgi:hypothetical protein
MRRWGFVWVVVLVVALVVPVAGLVVVGLFVPDSLSKNAAAPVPVTMPVTSQTDARAVGVQASLKWVGGPSLLAPGWSGLVTGVSVGAGSSVSSGTPIVVIDGLTRVALVSASPFYRSLSVGVSGPDVQMLRDALLPLKGTGLTGRGDTFDAVLQRSVKAFQVKFLGVAPADADGVFDPSMVVFLPVPSLVVGKVDAAVGTLPPAQGMAVVESTSVLQPFTFGPMTDSSGKAGAPLPSSSTGYEFVPAVGPTLAVGKGFAISDPASLAAVTAAFPGRPDSITGQVQLVDPETYSVVPASAIVTGTDGHYCVFRAGDGGRFVSYPVTPGGGLPGQTEVTGLDASVDSVVANPAQLGLLGCAAR